ncbi:MFS transporter [Actinoplanes sp. NBC_00393]|uniref:MFS transporter n=1 Tax=Actinoplanes sp. NBC_00393 TaxID=2975953 RepID=UPI002E24BFE4
MASAVGPVLAEQETLALSSTHLAIWGLRRHLPESPRWLIMHGREDEAEENIARIERAVEGRRWTSRRRSTSGPASRTAISRCCGCCSGSIRPGRRWAPR